jgi:hypothetical protein
MGKCRVVWLIGELAEGWIFDDDDKQDWIQVLVMSCCDFGRDMKELRIV